MTLKKNVYKIKEMLTGFRRFIFMKCKRMKITKPVNKIQYDRNAGQ